MASHISFIDTTTAPDALLEELSAYYDVVEAEDMPGDPPTPLEQRVADWRHASTHYPVFRWILREDGQIAAIAVAAFDVAQNLENGYGRIHVAPDRRGRGLARAIATPLFDHLEAAGRTRFDTWVKEGTAAEALTKRLGLKLAYREKRSRLVIDDLDHELMRTWIDRASERASDYRLAYYESPLPEDIVQEFCDLAGVMNTAPREDYEAEDEVLTVAQFREREANAAEAKQRLHHLIAVHEPSGGFAGYTQLQTQSLQPDLGWQWDTGVRPEHRNKGLGRWLKAALIERVVREYPALTRVDTFNAGSNEPMLNINIEMGFEPVHVSTTWQGDLATVRERLRA